MAADDRQNRTFSLIIKTPNRDQEDWTVDRVPPDWTVLDLKRHLSAVYPSRPAVSEQRLIFSGKLLPDLLHIRELFSQTDSVLSLHLVCPVRSHPGGRPGHKVGDADDQPGSSGRPSPSMASDTPELRQRRSPSSSSSSSSSSAQRPAAGYEAPPMTPPSFPAHSLYSRQQLLWLQQAYARQFYLQYHAALAAAGSASLTPAAAATAPSPPVPPHPVQVPAPLVNQNPIDNLPANQNAAPDGAFVNPGAANQNLRMNAQGGPVMEDEEEAERDWLDWMYSAVRLGVLLAIVYFNSNLSRFLLVMSTLLLMYLHTAGWFPFRRVQVSLMWTAWVFFKTFFSSLIPEVPQGVAN